MSEQNTLLLIVPGQLCVDDLYPEIHFRILKYRPTCPDGFGSVRGRLWELPAFLFLSERERQTSTTGAWRTKPTAGNVSWSSPPSTAYTGALLRKRREPLKLRGVVHINELKERSATTP